MIFFKNQNDVVLVKKKKQKSTCCNQIFDRVNQVSQVTPGFDFPYFFLKPDLVLAPGPGLTRRTGFKTLPLSPQVFLLFFFSIVLLCNYARAYILHMFGIILFTDLSETYMSLFYLPLREDFEFISLYSWGTRR